MTNNSTTYASTMQQFKRFKHELLHVVTCVCFQTTYCLCLFRVNSCYCYTQLHVFASGQLLNNKHYSYIYIYVYTYLSLSIYIYIYIYIYIHACVTRERFIVIYLFTYVVIHVFMYVFICYLFYCTQLHVFVSGQLLKGRPLRWLLDHPMKQYIYIYIHIHMFMYISLSLYIYIYIQIAIHIQVYTYIN